MHRSDLEVSWGLWFAKNTDLLSLASVARLGYNYAMRETEWLRRLADLRACEGVGDLRDWDFLREREGDLFRDGDLDLFGEWLSDRLRFVLLCRNMLRISSFSCRICLICDMISSRGPSPLRTDFVWPSLWPSGW